MVRVSRVAITSQLTINASPTSLGVLQVLEHDHSGAFAHNEPVALLVERTRGVLGILIARAHGFHSAEASDANGNNGGLGAAGEHDLGITHLNGAPGLTNRMIGSRAGGARGEVWAAQILVHGKHA